MTSTAIADPIHTVRDRITDGLRRFADEVAIDPRIPVTIHNFQFLIVAHSLGEVRNAAKTQDAAVDEKYDDQDRLLSATCRLYYDGLIVGVAFYSPDAIRRYEAAASYGPVVQA